MPLFVMLTPFLMIVTLLYFGLPGAYLSLAAISLALLVPLLFVIDYPPAAASAPPHRTTPEWAPALC